MTMFDSQFSVSRFMVLNADHVAKISLFSIRLMGMLGKKVILGSMTFYSVFSVSWSIFLLLALGETISLPPPK